MEHKFIREVIKKGERYQGVIGRLDDDMKNLKSNIDGHNTGVGWSKIAGGASTVIGGGLLIAAPFTAGATLMAGVGFTAAGATTTVGASIGDYVQSNDFVDKMQAAQKELIEAKEAYGQALLMLMHLAAIENGMQPSQIAQMTIEGLAGVTGVGQVLFATQAAAKTLVVETGVGAAGVARTTGTSVVIAGSKSASAGASEAGSAAAGGAATAGASNLAKGFGIAGGILGVAAGSFDIYNGISGLTDGHPTMETLDSLLQVISKEVTDTEEELSKLRNCL